MVPASWFDLVRVQLNMQEWNRTKHADWFYVNMTFHYNIGDNLLNLITKPHDDFAFHTLCNRVLQIICRGDSKVLVAKSITQNLISAK